MGKLNRCLTFAAPLEKVWRVFADIGNYPKWVDGVQEVKIESGLREGKGVRWQEKCLFEIGGLLGLDHEIREWEDKKRAVIHTDLPMNGRMRRILDFKNTGASSTEVDVDTEWDLGLAEAIIGADALRQMLEKSFDRTYVNWKAQAESCV